MPEAELREGKRASALRCCARNSNFVTQLEQMMMQFVAFSSSHGVAATAFETPSTRHVALLLNDSHCDAVSFRLQLIKSSIRQASDYHNLIRPTFHERNEIAVPQQRRQAGEEMLKDGSGRLNLFRAELPLNSASRNSFNYARPRCCHAKRVKSN